MTSLTQSLRQVGFLRFVSRQAIVAPFAVALFVSAFLLFSVEPMMAKAITPLLGGTPAVWISCMLFFQILLLVGYLYVHISFRYLGTRKQALVQLALVALPLFLLPIVIREEDVQGWNRTDNPTISLLLLLARSIGPAFVVLSMSGPLFQSWFAALPNTPEGKRDPYVLYAASNAGSVAALAAYPFLIEPLIGLKSQFSLWHGAYIAFGALVIFSAFPLILSKKSDDSAAAAPEASAPTDRPSRSRWHTRFLWCGLAFVPSTYMMGLTTFVTTDVAPVPLFWVVPLLLYLVTFIIVFSNRQLLPDRILDKAVVAGLTLSAAAGVIGGAIATILIHLVTFFVVTLYCHSRLVRLRPQPSELTDFFMWLSLGGALGGIFNGVVAPVAFSRAVEYPIALVLAAFCRTIDPGAKDVSNPTEARGSRRMAMDAAFALLTGGALALIVFLGKRLRADDSLLYTLGTALPFVLAYTAREHAQRFALALGALFLAIGFHAGNLAESLYVERNFFGVIGVAQEGHMRRFMHGNIVHGLQNMDPANPAKRREPLAYHHRRGPLGEVFELYGSQLRNVAVVGLGAGAMAAYAKPDQSWVFYEINPAVVRVALNPDYFTYLSDAFPNGRGSRIEVGDARLRLQEEPDALFSIIVLDAFSSDAVPVHLLTREAIDLYLRKLDKGGLLVFNISNRFLRLGSAMGAVGHDRNLQVVGKSLLSPSKELVDDNLEASVWVVMARDSATLEPLRGRGFRAIEAKEHTKPWTDDYSDIVSAYRL